jgi:hypothetical protein
MDGYWNDHCCVSCFSREASKARRLKEELQKPVDQAMGGNFSHNVKNETSCSTLRLGAHQASMCARKSMIRIVFLSAFVRR